MKGWDLNKGTKQTHLEGSLAVIENKHKNFCESLSPFIVVLPFPPGK
jgi:hypothetical protein